MTRNYSKVWQDYNVSQLLQSVTGVTKCDSQSLQSVTGFTKCDKKLLKNVAGITNCNSYYKVWYAVLIYKLKSSGINWWLVESFSNRFQRVLLNGQISDWLPVKTGLPQDSILGPLFFLININDLTDNLVSSVKIFADDTSLFSTVHDTKLNNDLKKISEWAYK